jgi:phosphonate degradation associated HDIG domain protein
MTMGDQIDVVALLRDIFLRRGSDSYLGEEVTMSEHMLQAAALADAEGADDALVVAALLHDVGHYVDEFGAYAKTDKFDKQHDVVGAELLAPYFDSRVVAAVRLHVAAKRYLCATRPEYAAQLSAASVHTLSLQGGPMSSTEVAEFEKIAGFRDAVRVRLWDDRAKVSRAPTRSFDDYVPLLFRSLRTVD